MYPMITAVPQQNQHNDCKALAHSDTWIWLWSYTLLKYWEPVSFLITKDCEGLWHVLIDISKYLYIAQHKPNSDLKFPTIHLTWYWVFKCLCTVPMGQDLDVVFVTSLTVWDLWISNRIPEQSAILCIPQQPCKQRSSHELSPPTCHHRQ
jgi:hypothetical protein